MLCPRLWPDDYLVSQFFMLYFQRIRQGATMLPGIQPCLCSEIRLACYLKPYHVRKGVGGGEPPCMSQKPVILEEEG